MGMYDQYIKNNSHALSYPFAAATIANAMPVFPLVASINVF